MQKSEKTKNAKNEWKPENSKIWKGQKGKNIEKGPKTWEVDISKKRNIETRDSKKAEMGTKQKRILYLFFALPPWSNQS